MKTLNTILSFLFLVSAAHAQTAENILLILNESSPISLEVGQYYAQKRGVPAQNILRLRTTMGDEISREDFVAQIEVPIATWFMRNSTQDRILYIVLTKGIPLRVQGSSSPNGTIASVDSELTLLYRKFTGVQVALAGPIKNPYYLGDAPVDRAPQLTHKAYDIYLVSRLDGYTSADIRGLIDRGFAPSREGKILLDQKGSSNDKGDNWLMMAADWMIANGYKDRLVFDSSSNVIKDQTGVLGYYSWGSNDPAIRMRHFNLTFVAGALGGMYVSSDGRSFAEPPPDWQVGSWDDKGPRFAGSPQSMAGDLIRDGITGIAGHVAEPYLEAAIHPNILFPAYLSGFNLIESYYLAMPYLSWQTVVVGDPLCAPFRSTLLSSQEIDKGIDPETELPGYLSERLLRVASASPVRPGVVEQDTVKLLLRADVRLAKQDIAGARQTLEEATARDSRLVAAQLLLASIYEQSKEYDKADERYRRVLELTPDNLLALNNLAYSLAVRHNSLEEALRLAEKAYSLANENANVQDTLAWIHHLSGKNDKAGKLLQMAVQKNPQNAEMRLHLAIVLAALGQNLQASVELARAVELDPTLENTDEVRQLRAKLKKPPKPS